MKSISMDSKALRFATKLSVFIVLSFTAVQYGTAIATQKIENDSKQDLLRIDEKIRETEQLRKMRSYGSLTLLQKMHAYKREIEARVSVVEPTVARTIGGTSFDTLSAGRGKWIGADLTAMKLYLYEDGFAVDTFDIKSKGRKGSRWETPTGLYSIETKERTHFSSIGEVNMPYSMEFFGNFFIHGWPTYPDGRPVAEGFSGGCIRLATDDAGKVFEFAKENTPVFVWTGEQASSTPFEVTQKSIPKLTAKSFLVADIENGRVFAEKDADLPLPVASLTKLLTALVANETIHYDRKITVTADDHKQAEGSPGSIGPDDTFAAGDLLYPLLLESNNAVAYALARYFGISSFFTQMNEKAHAIGMTNTKIKEPAGISPEDDASANDIFVLTRYIHDSQSFILDTTRQTNKHITSVDGKKYTLSNFNVFADNPAFLGGKTGFTDDAKETMTAVFKVPIQGKDATIAIVVLGSDNRKKDVETLLAWFKSAATIGATSTKAI